MKEKFWEEATYRDIVIMVERATKETRITDSEGGFVIAQPGDYLCRDLHGFIWREEILSSRVYPKVTQLCNNVLMVSTSFRVSVAKKSFLVKSHGVSIFRGVRGDAVVVFAAGTLVIIRRGINQKNIFSEAPSIYPLHVDATKKHNITFLF